MRRAMDRRERFEDNIVQRMHKGKAAPEAMIAIVDSCSYGYIG